MTAYKAKATKAVASPLAKRTVAHGSMRLGQGIYMENPITIKQLDAMANIDKENVDLSLGEIPYKPNISLNKMDLFVEV